ncbi:hypothetical protein P153DRAFT_381542 [Dothidotthia symphoricarpi CBS 119687]|uniref:RING-CH-type domain-containing protein n=1 Tax=Dothidotthia symphoricarpi CBS 119687 TaxID=1392245 RepID=A0A6A6AME1_9PLEO|nr:uncharacterized protein P153DRAFT_381542 [Dothidotthia symphoricarpi CBS 119687]KAF2133099.1 hypothetical protein P153DRAFT_381542 [Dothidotthia symphoricarpi CBS 119687]
MASLPQQRPASQRRRSPSPQSSSHQQEAARSSSVSDQSVDSQTLLPNSPPAQSAKPAPEAQQEAPPQHLPPQEDDEPRRCWICFNDETEDDATTSEWRSPCPCVLVAHEKCLLDWIADMEAPNSRRRAGNRVNKVLCPQCKAEIKLQRPTNYIVEAVRLGERFTGSLLLPGFAFVTGTALYSTLTLAGTHTIYQIFGPGDAAQILRPLYEVPNPQLTTATMRLLEHVRQHWRLDIGLPLIPTVLVASRTTLADSFLPFLPLIFFVSSGQPGDDMLQLQWPPSAAFSFAALPYLRGLYNAFYDRVCLPREQKWLKEIQPRAGTDDAAEPQVVIEDELGHVHDHLPDDAHIVDVEVDFDIFADWNGNAADDHDHNHDHDHDHDHPPVAHPINAPPMDDDAEVPQPLNIDHVAPAPNVRVQPQQRPRPRVRRERNMTFSTTSVADTILGALIFPSIAAAMGELLRYTLPTSWVLPPSGASASSWLGGWARVGGKAGKPTGFLQTRWGRSLVGGCLFVGLKDAVLLYVRWKVAQNHRRRTILNCKEGVGKKGRGAA